jgi:hypothetical protein
MLVLAKTGGNVVLSYMNPPDCPSTPTTRNSMIKTILITNDPAIATDAQAAGVSRIMVDLETMGKKERQATRNTFISTHVKEDVATIRAVVDKAQLMVRINAMHFGSHEEIDHAVGEGADIVMLPMITRMVQFDDFMAHLAGRAKPLPLLETSYSMAHISDIAFHPDITELYFGLNDLHLSLGLDFLFEPLALGLIDWMAGMVHSCNKSFGFGGIAAIGGAGELPPERILGEHARLGSSCVILSSRFARDVQLHEPQGRYERIKKAVDDLHSRWDELNRRSPELTQLEARDTFVRIRTLADQVRKNA